MAAPDHIRQALITFKKGLSVECSLRLGHQSLEGFGFAYSDVGQNFTVEFNTSLFEAIHELRVAQTIFTGTGVDALDPQAAELALFDAAVAIGILHAFFNGLHCGAESILAAAAVTLGSINNLAVTGVRCHAPFYTSHFLTLFRLSRTAGIF